jgi:acylphosphatase
MNKCIKLIFNLIGSAQLAYTFIQKEARKIGLEGMVTIESDDGRGTIIACGNKDMVDDFIDALHKGAKGCQLEDIEIEPFLKDKDYRGVFRIIE